MADSIPQDPQQQILMALAALTQGGRGASRTDIEKILTNPMLGFLLGGADYMTALPQSPAGGELWSRYSQSVDPDFQVILSTIQSGGDKYQVEQAINDIIAKGASSGSAPFREFGAMPVESLRSLAEDLRKEYQEPAKGKGGIAEMFTEAGFANPLEQYTYEDVPLTTAGAQLRSMGASKMQELQERQSQTQKMLAAAKARADAEERTMEDYSVAMNKQQKRSGWQSLPGVSLLLEGVNEGLKVGEDIVDRARGKTNVKTNPRYKQAQKDLRSAQRADVQALIALRQQKANEEAFRRGIERGIAEKAGTPFQAQLTNRLAMAQYLGLT